MTRVKTTDGVNVAPKVLAYTETIAQEEGSLVGIALANSSATETLGTTKLEKKEMVYSPIKLVVTTAITSGYFDDTNKTVACSGGGASDLRIGDIIEFQDADKKSKGTLRIMVTELTSDTAFKAIKLGGADVAIADTDLAYVSTYAQEEGKKNTESRGIKTPRKIWNQTQIMRYAAEISGSLAKTNNWDFTNVKQELIRQAGNDLRNQLGGMLGSSIRVSKTIAGKEVRISGGLSYFIENKFDANGDVVVGTPDNVKSLGDADVTMAKIEDAFQYAIEQGGSINAIRCSPAQARKISAFENTKVNIVVNQSNADTVGGAVQVLKSPIQVGKGMRIEAIYVDTQMASDRIELFNDKNVRVEFFRIEGGKATEPTSKDDNYFFGGIVEATMYYANAAESTYLLTDCGI